MVMQNKAREVPQKCASGNGARVAAQLGQGLEGILTCYVAAAAGLSCLSTPVVAQIVYTPSNTPMAHTIMGSYAHTPLDLNHDGVADFTFVNFAYESFGRSSEFSGIYGAAGANSVAGVQLRGQHNITAAALPQGVEVGPNDNFVHGANMVHMFNDTQGGYGSGGWTSLEWGYLGLKFVIDGDVHYGWVLVKFPYPYAFLSGSIYGYAYESAPNRSILTGQTTEDDQGGQQSDAVVSPATGKASLGLLATGAIGLPYWRSSGNSRKTFPLKQSEAR